MIRVLIADSHRILRRGIREIIEGAGNITVVGEVESNRQILTAIHKNEFDLLLLDFSKQGDKSLDILKDIFKQKPEIKVLILILSSEQELALRAMHLNIHGYLTEKSTPEELIAAIRKVARGDNQINPALMNDLSRESPRAHEALSKREFQILRKLAAGKTPTEIAKELSISIKTVSTYRARIMAKLELKNTAEIIRYAIQHDLVE